MLASPCRVVTPPWGHAPQLEKRCSKVYSEMLIIVDAAIKTSIFFTPATISGVTFFSAQDGRNEVGPFLDSQLPSFWPKALKNYQNVGRKSFNLGRRQNRRNTWLKAIPKTCTAESSLSALKRVKTEMRSTTKNEKSNSLMLLCIQNDITMEMDYNDDINYFAVAKAGRKR
ncbi:hypothetical protein TNCV_2572271 [Trichonephila clavipes]|nr:hypothetical protein TNCV_2572271 [Trichonephila clavipes]